MMQPCGIAKLMSAIFEVPLEEGYQAAGLACCPVCDKAGTNPTYYPYCGLQHERKGTGVGPKGGQGSVMMMCERCEVSFPRSIAEIKSQARHRDRRSHTGDYHVFCSHVCQGHWLADNYGVKPGDKGRSGSKYDYDSMRIRALTNNEPTG